jgi:hypothetical protein
MTQANTGNPAGQHVVTRFKTSGTKPEPSEFQRFERLTRKLANVPHREVDEKRNKSKRSDAG